jgi:hypothetical protein
VTLKILRGSTYLSHSACCSFSLHPPTRAPNTPRNHSSSRISTWQAPSLHYRLIHTALQSPQASTYSTTPAYWLSNAHASTSNLYILETLARSSTLVHCTACLIYAWFRCSISALQPLHARSASICIPPVVSNTPAFFHSAAFGIDQEQRKRFCGPSPFNGACSAALTHIIRLVLTSPLDASARPYAHPIYYPLYDLLHGSSPMWLRQERSSPALRRHKLMPLRSSCAPVAYLPNALVLLLFTTLAYSLTRPSLPPPSAGILASLTHYTFVLRFFFLSTILCRHVSQQTAFLSNVASS